ncbi:aryl-alcohol dehydrogenase/geraniol dehydrogenase (NAD+) [Sphingopyxis italica]|uniref:Aryl-alcohol dehydrogenase/geraniol dehydrogenase (NAD+) n=1 Tax=Sphingopyxis italica TaxID=1129133 RepID=A0A7X5XRS7_9SPHN|nr:MULTISPECIES: NAD(P)-dependent alcohol dehydrogenase [Sphingopyxis]MDT7529118.1 NAD(P)-dependent alcohol dehydrogenase [Sphingopyxis sp. SE2]NJB90114.1 aryl-alcohol dehydrogenase/geraniol dehydrogenase (NAD+) [Sphingopyxis italica]
MKATAAIVRAVGGDFSIEDIEVAEPRGAEVRVRIVGVGMCHTDLVARDGFPVPMPIVLGHEGAGVVESVGPEVTDLAPGDHVVLSFDSCAACPTCDEGLPAYCHQFLGKNFAGVRLEDGTSPLSQAGDVIHGNFFGQSSFGAYAVAHRRNTVKVDPALPLEILGPLGCGIMTGAGSAVISLGIRPGQSLAIFGGGAVGLSALLGALAVGAGPVIVVEPNTERRALALELGAAHVIDPAATEDVLAAVKELSGGGVNHALDTTGIPAVVAVAVETTVAHGTVGLVAVPPPEAMLPANMMSMLVRGTTIKYITEGDADPQEFIPRMIGWYRDGKFPFDRLIRKFPFAEINAAAHASEDGSAIKPVLIL